MALSLNALKLNIDPETGEALDMEECVLATYDSAMYFGGLALPSGAGLEIEDLLLPYVEGISLAGAGEAARSAT